ncbi:uncharacterized protein LOC115625977 [Scaptodrosophila lebanonensis]|uniref:Uncharacterized protein LOC115625977 n=1 Tax=Drosophila lebanonensis TaxID=7225 RepID=A0A6J2TNI6_DROLE|nr:uncharacterized protein LOC115625977 [Scaptodrosophila lebanonensis]XP_030377082.1 uncharacterized protein LOC115625977 [Scaptodrosophila lebanonensis]
MAKPRSKQPKKRGAPAARGRRNEAGTRRARNRRVGNRRRQIRPRFRNGQRLAEIQHELKKRLPRSSDRGSVRPPRRRRLVAPRQTRTRVRQGRGRLNVARRPRPRMRAAPQRKRKPNVSTKKLKKSMEEEKTRVCVDKMSISTQTPDVDYFYSSHLLSMLDRGPNFAVPLTATPRSTDMTDGRSGQSSSSIKNQQEEQVNQEELSNEHQNNAPSPQTRINLDEDQVNFFDALCEVAHNRNENPRNTLANLIARQSVYFIGVLPDPSSTSLAGDQHNIELDLGAAGDGVHVGPPVFDNDEESDE